MKYVSNGFSPKMLNPNRQLNFTIEETTYDEIQLNRSELVSSIGHQLLADHLNLEKNRINIQLEVGDILYLVYTSKDLKEFFYKKISINT